MPSLSAARAFNASLTLPYRPVGVFVGGTSGIGEGLVRAFAQHTRGDADIVIVGRNRAAGEAILAALPTPPPPADPPRREFVQCDAALMRNVQRATDELAARLPRLNYLVVTTGMMTLKGRDETEEGIDRKLAVHYYSRWKFFHNLVPLLQKAKDAGEDARAMTVLGAGVAKPINLDDLGLKKTFSVPAAAYQGPTYNDCMIESFAERHPALTFVHADPGPVRTPLAASSDSLLLRLAAPAMGVIGRAIGMRAPAESAEHLLCGLLRAPAGAARIGPAGDDLAGKGLFTTPEVRAKVWAHTAAETRTEV